MHAFSCFKGGPSGTQRKVPLRDYRQGLTLPFFWQYHEYHSRVPRIRAGAGHNSWTSVVWLDFFVYAAGLGLACAAVGASRLLRT